MFKMFVNLPAVIVFASSPDTGWNTLHM